VTGHTLTLRSLDGQAWGTIEAACPVCGVRRFHTAGAAYTWHGNLTRNLPTPVMASKCRGAWE